MARAVAGPECGGSATAFARHRSPALWSNRIAPSGPKIGLYASHRRHSLDHSGVRSRGGRGGLRGGGPVAGMVAGGGVLPPPPRGPRHRLQPRAPRRTPPPPLPVPRLRVRRAPAFGPVL